MHGLSAAVVALKSGRYRDAERLCRQVLTRDPINPSALNMLGIVAGKSGNHAQAADLMRKSLVLKPDDLGLRLNLAAALIADGQLDDAESTLSEAVGRDQHADNPRLWSLWGNVQTLQGNREAGLAAFHKSLKHNPNQADVLFNLGEAYRQAGNLDAAVEQLKRALELNPRNADALNNLSGLQLYRGEFLDALRNIQTLLQLKPRSAQAYLNLGVALRLAGDPLEAMQSYRNALALNPKLTTALFDLMTLHGTMGEFDEAEKLARRIEELDPDDIRLHVGRARIAERKGDVQAAAKHIQLAYDRSPLNGDAVIVYANVQDQLGNTDRAIEALERFLESRAGGAEHEIGVLFTLGALYDNVGRHDDAFSHIHTANESRRQGLVTEFTREEFEGEIDQLLAAYSSARFSRIPRASIRTELPIFIIGVPRSGTSLLEQILASHPDVHGAGELNDIRELIRSTHVDAADETDAAAGFTIVEDERLTDYHIPADIDGLTADGLNAVANTYLNKLRSLGGDAKRVTDKMPYNFHVVGFLRLLFPAAPIIHCRRDPLDTCLSCYFQNFFRGNYQSFDLRTLGSYYRGYERIMRHWQETLNIDVLDVRYEDLVQDPEPHVRKILQHCNLEWDDRCLQFHKSKRVIDTASYQQVRKPIYTKSVERWKRYEKHLGPLIDALRVMPPR